MADNNPIALSIIIVNWNSKDHVRKCLQSIYAHTRGLSYEIIIVDSASYDGCGEMLALEFPGVKFIQCEQNVGFARANNLGFERSRGGCVLFLNPDTELVGPAVNLLFDALVGLKDAGAVGARLLNTDDSLQTSCIQTFPTILNQLLDAEILRRTFPRLPLWGMAALFNASSEPSEVQAIIGACVMLKREVFERVRRFDEGYFMYAEDIDLSFKVHQAGFKRYFLPAATLIHHGGGSSKSARSNFSTIMMRESIYHFMRVRRGRCSAAMFRLSQGFAALFRLPFAAVFSLWRGRQAVATTASVKKWFSILRWSLGLERWARYKIATQK
jgi:GT2 family glycosyltransferase